MWKGGEMFKQEIGNGPAESNVSDLRRRDLEPEERVTNCRPTENELLENETRLRFLLDNIKDCYFEFDLAGNLTFCNSATCRMCGYSMDELIGMNNREYTTPEVSKRMYEIFNAIYLTGKPAEVPGCEVIAKDGTVKICEFEASLMRDQGGSPVGFKGIIRDISTVRHTEEFYKTILENSFSGVYITCQGTIQYINRKAARYFGCNPEALFGTSTMNLVHPDDRALLKKHAREMIKGKRAIPYEFRLLDKNGEYGWVLESVCPIIYKEKPAILGTCIDITERKQFESVILESEQRLASIIDFLPDAALIVDMDGKVVAWNRAMEDMTGVKADHMIGKGDYEYAVPFFGKRRPILVDCVIHPDLDIEESYVNVNRDGESMDAEVPDVWLNGRKSIVWTAVAPIFNTAGEKIGAIETMRDITEQKMVEEQLRYMSTHDSLTGLYSRSFFEEEMSRFEKGRIFSVSIIMMDVDCLKQVNDTKGHQEGDALLRRVAQILGMALRADDIAARIGGDEFAVLLPGTDISTAQEIVARLRNALEENNRQHPESSLSLSIGVAEGFKGDSLTSVEKKADERMYEEKLAKKKSR